MSQQMNLKISQAMKGIGGLRVYYIRCLITLGVVETEDDRQEPQSREEEVAG
jgi:hypothetical protein